MVINIDCGCLRFLENMNIRAKDLIIETILSFDSISVIGFIKI